MLLRILFFHCKKLEFRDKRKSNRPLGISDTSQGIKKQLFEEVLAAFICVEKWDTREKINDYCNTILDLLKLNKRDFVAIIPFVHLSNYIANPSVAFTILEEIIANLKKQGIKVGVSSFGYHKEFELLSIDYMHSYGHPGSVAFRRIPENDEDTFLDLVNELGIERCEQLLNQIRSEKNV